MINVESCIACKQSHANVRLELDDAGEYFMCSFSGRRVNVTRYPAMTVWTTLKAEASSGVSMSPPYSPNLPQPAPRRGFGPCTWDLVIADMKDRDQTGERKYGLRHQWDNGRDHLVDAYQENLDQSLYLRAEIQKRRRMQELARTLVGPENSAPLAELLELVLAGAP